MKIHNSLQAPDSGRIGQSQGATPSTASTRASAATSASSADAVQVSTSAQLAAEAARRLAGTASEDDVRPEVVARAKAAVANGEVGTDLNKLADRLIDGMLGE